MTQTLINTTTSNTPALYMALELGGSRWVLASAGGIGGGWKPRVKTIDAGDLGKLSVEIATAKARFDLPAKAPVRTVYEAGRDSFWVHRALESLGIHNVIVNPASIRVDRRRRRAKTDRLDAQELLSNLQRHWAGELNVWKLIRIPSEQQEDDRRLSRELDRLRKSKRQVASKINAALATIGCKLPRESRGAIGRLMKKALTQWDGSPCPRHLRRELTRLVAQHDLLLLQIKEVEQEQEQMLTDEHSETAEKARKLKSLKSVGSKLAITLATELFGWRRFSNRKEVGSFLGLTPTPYSSDGIQREQGISKAGSPHLRAQMIQLAWLWLRWQKSTALARDFNAKWAASKRSKRVGIVALARKLLIALWRWIEFDELPEGAALTLSPRS